MDWSWLFNVGPMPPGLQPSPVASDPYGIGTAPAPFNLGQVVGGLPAGVQQPVPGPGPVLKVPDRLAGGGPAQYAPAVPGGGVEAPAIAPNNLPPGPMPYQGPGLAAYEPQPGIGSPQVPYGNPAVGGVTDGGFHYQRPGNMQPAAPQVNGGAGAIGGDAAPNPSSTPQQASGPASATQAPGVQGLMQALAGLVAPEQQQGPYVSSPATPKVSDPVTLAIQALLQAGRGGGVAPMPGLGPTLGA